MTDPSWTINRRIALQLMATASAGAIAAPSVLAQTLPSNKSSSTINNTNPATGTRFNLSEAQRVMHELEIDALVLGDGRNFQQATGCLPIIAKMGWPSMNVAMLIAKPEPHVVIIMPGFSYYFIASDLHSFSDNDVYIYGLNDATDISIDEALSSVRFPDRGEAPLREIEKHRVASTKQVLEQKRLHSSLADALKSALKAADIKTGNVAYDNADIGQLLTQFAPELTLRFADDALRRIRTIKSDIEIQLMRASSKINVDSAFAAVGQIGAGASHQDLRQAYYQALNKRGANGVFMVIDQVSEEQYNAELVKGQGFLIDCVGDYQGYLGDYGRTVFIGEPRKSVLNAQRTVGKAWDHLRDKLKPGMTFSDIEALGQKAMKEQGSTYRVPFKPHSVGVFHSDHLGNGSSGPREDIVLRPGMIISIDCPVLESGFGGSVHLEDLMLITEDGAEPINDTGHQAIII